MEARNESLEGPAPAVGSSNLGGATETLIRKQTMPLVPDNTLITATPEEGRALAIMIARKTIAAIQPDADARGGLRALYANDPALLTAAGHVVAIEFQTVAAANNYWRD